MAWPVDETFEIYVDDDRYAVPTFHLIPAEDEDVAFRVARRLLEESPHHLGVEVCLDGRRLTGIGSFATRRAAMPQSSSGSSSGASAGD